MSAADQIVKKHASTVRMQGAWIISKSMKSNAELVKYAIQNNLI